MQPTLSAELLFAFYFRRQGRNEPASHDFSCKINKKNEPERKKIEKKLSLLKKR